jgi:hypothetical protein
VSRRIAAAALLAVGLGGGACQGPAPAPAPAPLGEPAPPAAGGARIPASVELGATPPVDGLGPGILLPREGSADDVVARIGGLGLKKSQVFDRMLEINRRGTRSMIDVLIMDAVVAEQARTHGIDIEPDRIDALVDEEEKFVRDRVRVEFGGRRTFDDYVRGQFDMSVEEYHDFLRRELARERYRSLVIRFLSLLEDRVQVRFIACRDRAVLEDVRKKVLDGADFATLAMRHSEDETRRDGGLLPPFGRDFQHPIAKVAFELEPGALSEVFSFETDGVGRECLVYCLKRMPGQSGLRFADVKGELVTGIEQRPLSPFEQKEFMLRYCGGGEFLPTGTSRR